MKKKISALIFLGCMITGMIASEESSTVKVSTHKDSIYNDQNPQIATDSSGNSYVVWEGSDGDDNEIYWVKIEEGTPGTVLKISTHKDSIYDDQNPQIATDSSGNSYVVWEGSDGDDNEIYWVKIEEGTPGTVLKISTHEDNQKGDDYGPQIAVDASGTSYVVWEGSYPGTDSEIYWTKIDPAGVPGQVKKISIHNDNMIWNDYTPQIAVDTSGNSYVVWQGYDGNDQDIYWVAIDSSNTLKDVHKISTHVDNADRDDIGPQIAVDTSGNSYVVWYCSDGSDQEIYWVNIDTNINTGAGAPYAPGTVKKISTHLDNDTRDDWHPRIAADSSGNSYVVWYCSDGNDYEIYWVNIRNGAWKSVLKLSTHNDNTIWDDYDPQIAVDSSGNSFVVWYGFDSIDNEIYWVRVDTSQMPGVVQKISLHKDNKEEDDQHPSIGVDAQGKSYVVWEGFDGSDSEIYFGKPSATGKIDFTGPTTSIISTTSDRPPYKFTSVITAIISDVTAGNSSIKAAEYFIDSKGTNGAGIPMVAVDGAFDSAKETVTAMIDVTKLSIGLHTVFIHGLDEQGNWGRYQAVQIWVFYPEIE